MEQSILFQIRSMLKHGVRGLIKLIIPAVILEIIGVFVLHHGTTREMTLRFAIVLPFIGFLWGLRVYEYSARFSHWKNYRDGTSTLGKAFSHIAYRKLWLFMLPMAYICGLAIGIIFYLVVPFKTEIGKFYIHQFSAVTYLFLVPACSVLLLFGANAFGPKPDEEEELALDVLGILNQSPKISPKDIGSPSAIERFMEGIKTVKGIDVKPYLWILSHIRPPGTIEAFQSVLQNSDLQVRRIAVTYLARMADSNNAVQLLRDHLANETDPGIIKLIEESISRAE